MKQFIAFVIKETKHILRDKRTMLILFGMPVVMMLLFGFAITTDVKNVRTVVVTSEMSPRTQQVVERLAQSEYFIITQTVNTPQEAEQLIRSQKADMALVFTQNRGMQIMVDGSDPNMTQQWTNYAQQTIASSNSHLSPLTSYLSPLIQSPDAFRLQLCASHHGYATDAHLCYDDLDIDCPRKGERYDGGAVSITC